MANKTTWPTSFSEDMVNGIVDHCIASYGKRLSMNDDTPLAALDQFLKNWVDQKFPGLSAKNKKVLFLNRGLQPLLEDHIHKQALFFGKGGTTPVFLKRSAFQVPLFRKDLQSAQQVYDFKDQYKRYEAYYEGPKDLLVVAAIKEMVLTMAFADISALAGMEEVRFCVGE